MGSCPEFYYILPVIWGKQGKERTEEEEEKERRLLHKENFSTYKRRIPTALLGLCSRVGSLVEFQDIVNRFLAQLIQFSKAEDL